MFMDICCHLPGMNFFWRYKRSTLILLGAPITGHNLYCFSLMVYDEFQSMWFNFLLPRFKEC